MPVELYELRGTKLVDSREFIPSYKIWLKALARSGYIPLQYPVLRAGTDCKNRDKLIYFIVRVRG